jgi:eukaryotic-like serine/threonine-protein kinase
MSDPAPLGADAEKSATGRYNQGTLLGSRFRIKEYLRRDGDIELYRASDAQSGADVALRVILPSGPGLAVLERDLARAQRLPPHKNLAAVVGVGREGPQLLVAYEGLDGHTLRDILDAHRRKGEVVDPVRAHTLLGHVAAGLSHAHGALVHAGVNPESVWLSPTGRVKVADLGLSAGLPAFSQRGGPRGSPPGLYFAPELTRAAPPTPASDVYSMGAILFELLTGSPPIPPLQPPSRLRSSIPPAVDGVIGRALMPAALTRFPTPDGLLQAFASAIGTPTDTVPNTDPGLVGTVTGAGGKASRTFDVAAAAGLSQGEARWLVQKDKLDYGPFSLDQLKHQITDGVFRGDHLIVDMDSGARQKIFDHPQLGDFTRQAERRLEQLRRHKAEHANEKVEKKKYRATVVIISVAVLVLGVGLTFYLTNREAAREGELASRAGDSDVDAFLKGVKVDFPRGQRPAVRRAARSAPGGRDDPFSAATNLGDVTQGGADEILSDRTIQNVMMGNYRKLVPCLMDEKRRSPGLKQMDLEFVVKGTGKVSAVRVNGQRQGAFPGCILTRMQAFNFPRYNGSQTIASWSMSLK